MAVYALGDKIPKIAESAYIHPQASVIGDVIIGERVRPIGQVTLKIEYQGIESDWWDLLMS
ncbi:MAG: hypothetical protein ACFFED_17950, partial [Candidatus Thorarchaeota archaeon]